MRTDIVSAIAALALCPATAMAEPTAPAIAPSAAPADGAVIASPRWTHRPTEMDLESVYPRRAIRDGISGLVVMSCEIEESGLLTGCVIKEEAPFGYGFAEAALKLVHIFRIEPARRNGQPMEHGTINIPIRFGNPDLTPGALAPTLAAYPAAARAAGIEGQATIRCARNAHLALQDCTLVSETPAGAGFGAAALAMAAKSPDNPKLNVTEAGLLAPKPITVRFALNPVQIDPDLTEMAHLVKRPQVAERPSQVVADRFYPERAAQSHVGGSAQLHCRVTREGRLTGCVVVQETPLGQNMGDAARLVAERDYRMTPMLYDGQPSDDGEADLTIAFGQK